MHVMTGNPQRASKFFSRRTVFIVEPASHRNATHRCGPSAILTVGVMAPVKPKSGSKRLARKSATAGPSKKSKTAKLPPKLSKQVKTKPASAAAKPKKRGPQYTDAQLQLPAMNGIVPAVANEAKRGGTGKKKNKVYVDDTEQMMTILAMVNAEKEGKIESKIMKERQLEEVREARRREAEKKKDTKKGAVQGVIDEIKKGKKHQRPEAKSEDKKPQEKVKKRKSVSFA